MQPGLSFGRSPYAAGLLSRYLVAVGLTAAGLTIALLLLPLGGVASASPLLFAVALSAWFAGIGPAILSQMFASGAAVLLLASVTGLPLPETEILGLLSFLLGGTLILTIFVSVRLTNYYRRSEEELKLLAHTSHDSLWEWNLKDNRVWRGGNLAEIFGIERRELVTDMSWWRERVHPDDLDRVWTSLQRAIAGKHSRWTEEYRSKRSDGFFVPVSDNGFLIKNRKGVPVRMVGGAINVSSHLEAEQRLLYNSLHDALTGLPNRELFLDRLHSLINSPLDRPGRTLAILYLNLDRFSTVNDSAGHVVGDQVLVEIAQRLVDCCGRAGLTARMGADEFTILLERAESLNQATGLASQIQEVLAVPFAVTDHTVVIAASIGIAFGASKSAGDILRHSEIAMHRAKAHGKARYEVFQPDLDARAMHVLRLESELRDGIAQNAFRLYYQPIVSLETGELVSFEALLRWIHPSRGVLLPSQFLQTADEAGLTVALGRRAIRDACRCLEDWRRRYPSAESLTVSVNLSGREFIQPRLLDELSRVLKETGVDGRLLTIEITESLIMESSETVLAKLNAIRELGIALAIDDFGKGYSSLGRLQEFPISILKVDGSFLNHLPGMKPQILRAVVAMAKELNLKVIAEAVETREQFDYLRGSGVTMGQGLFWSGALSPDDAAELLSKPLPWERYYTDQTGTRAKVARV